MHPGCWKSQMDIKKEGTNYIIIKQADVNNNNDKTSKL